MIISPPDMNYPLEKERDVIGNWSSIDRRMGTDECWCKCKHGDNICEHCSICCTKKGYSKPRSHTLYEKLRDCAKILGDLDDWIRFHDYEVERYCGFLSDVKWEELENVFNWQTLYEKLDWLKWLNCSMYELRVSQSILRHQVQAYKKILFPDEKKLIYSYCEICKDKRFFYRLSNLDRWLVCPTKHFKFNYTSLNSLLHCMKCHLVAYESDIGKIKYQEPKGFYGYIKSKPGYREFLQNFDELTKPIAIRDYYKDHEPHLKNLSVEKFFIVKDGKYFCIGCGCFYKRKHDAQKHMSNFWRGNYSNGCGKGVSSMLQQKALDVKNTSRGNGIAGECSKVG